MSMMINRCFSVRKVRIKVRISSKVERFLKLSMMVRSSPMTYHNKILLSSVSHLKNENNRQLSGRKHASIDLDNTEGVFSQQGLISSSVCVFLLFLYIEPLTIQGYGEQLPRDMSEERPKTAIRRKESNRNLFDENDDAAELLPD